MRSGFAGLCGMTSIVLGTAAICLVGCHKVDEPAQPAATITVTAGADNQQAPGDNENAPTIAQRKKNLFVAWDEGTNANLLVDNENGCEYIQDAHNTFPRMGKDGKQICRDDNRDTYWVKANDASPPAPAKKKH